MENSFYKVFKRKIRINILYFLLIKIYSREGILKKFFKGRLSQSDSIGKELFVTSIFSFDLHKVVILLTMFFSFALTFVFKEQFLIILQSVLAACIFDYITNILAKEYTKNIISCESSNLLLDIDKRIQNIKIQLGVDHNWGIKHGNLPNIKTIFLDEKRDKSCMIVIDSDLIKLNEVERKLKRDMTKLEYVKFLYSNNILDVQNLLAVKNIDYFPNLYKSLICTIQYSKGIKSFSNTNEFVSVFITNFDRISFWSRMELGLYTPQILNMGTNFVKQSISDYIIFGSIIVKCKNNILKEKRIFQIQYRKIINVTLMILEKVLILLSVYFIVKNSDLNLIKGMPEFLNQLFIKNDNQTFITGVSLGIIIIYTLNKMKCTFMGKSK